jgi:hypothetical protein
VSDEQFRELFHSMPYEEALNHCTAKCKVELQVTSRHSHINWWNGSKLGRMLTQAGFGSVYVSAAEQSASPVLRNEHYFDNLFNKVMLYVEAVNN